MIMPVQAADIQPGDRIQDRDWTLTVASVRRADWTDHSGKHTGIEVVTRQLGPNYPQHYALAEIVQVDRP